MLATDLDPMMRAKGKHARTHAIMACPTNMPLRLPLVWGKGRLVKALGHQKTGLNQTFEH